jgi:hypothetical protein
MIRSLLRNFVAAAAIVAAGTAVAGMLPMVGTSLPSGEQPAVLQSYDVIAPDPCALAQYPYLPASCLRTADGTPAAEVRWITFEARISHNESALVASPVR